MNILYPKPILWEEDYFKYILFDKTKYNININFVLYDHTTNFKIFSNQKNILILSCNYIPLDIIKNICFFLKPIIIFHLSDEWGKTQDYHLFYESLSSIRIVFHQHTHENLKYTKNHMKIPLGCIKEYPLDKMVLNNNKEYDFSFIGEYKSDRKEILELFQKHFSKSYINSNKTNWQSIQGQIVSPIKMYDIYSKSIFVPVGRGNYSLECFRMYEAILAGAIPVIIGNNKEIETCLILNGTMPKIVQATSYMEVIDKCKIIYNDKEKQKEIVEYNFKWWNEENNKIIQKIIEQI